MQTKTFKQILLLPVRVLEHNPEHATTIHLFGEEIKACSRCLGAYTSGLICYFIFAYIYLYTNIKLSFAFVFIASFILGSITLLDWATVALHIRQGNNKIRIFAGVLLGIAAMLYFWLLPESRMYRILTLIIYNLIAIFIAWIAIRRKNVRHKLVMVSEDKLHRDAKTDIVDFVKTRFVHGRSAQLQQIQEHFQKAPYELSEGSVINYLNELVDGRKLSTWKSKNLRYYGPPKIPLPIKFGIAVCTLIITLGVLIDNFSPGIVNYIYFTRTMLPLIVYTIVLSAIFTSVWYSSQRKLFK